MPEPLANGPTNRELERVLEADVAHAAQALAHGHIVEHGVHDLAILALEALKLLADPLKVFVADVVRHAAHDRDGKDDARAARALEDVEHGLAQAPAVVEERFESERVGQKAQPQQVRVAAGELLQNHAEVLGAARNLDAHELLGCRRIAVTMAEAADAANALGNVHELVEVALLHELLQAAVHESNLRDGLHHALVLNDKV